MIRLVFFIGLGAYKSLNCIKVEGEPLLKPFRVHEIAIINDRAREIVCQIIIIDSC